MKKIYTLLLLSISISFSAQIEGSWSLNPAAGALGVGPDSANTAWWTSDAGAVTNRNCLFDDSIVFSANGTYDHYMDGSTWLEPWQAGSPVEECGTPIAPHDGGSNTYTLSNGILTVSGAGAHIGLSKVHNGGEDGAAVNDQVVYHVTFSGASSETMTVDISFPNAGGTNGLGWWRFVYLKNGAAPPPPPASYIVTFNVHTDLITSVSTDGVYIGGGFVGGNDALLLADSDGDGVWTGSKDLLASGGHFTILNGNCSDYSCKEDISGQDCADANNYNDRNNLLGGFSQDTTINLQYGSCTTPSTGINELINSFSIYPNPSNGVITIQAANNINTVNIYNMIGNLVMVKNVANNQSTLNIENLTNGVYFIEINLNNGSVMNSKFIKK